MTTRNGEFPFLGFGVGLRPQHYPDILSARAPLDWFEIISENFLVAGGRPLAMLEQVRASHAIVMHGVSLSIGSVDPLDHDYLRRLRVLAQRIEPAWISDHLCWTGVGGHNLHDLLPLPYTEEAVRHVVARVQRVQDVLGRRILLENVSSYLEYTHSHLAEWEFLSAVATGADCGILLDINNIYVSGRNHGFSPTHYVDAVPLERVHQFHLAGYSDRGTFLHDTHDHPVSDPVWALYAHAVQRFGAVSTLIEWDEHMPPFAELCAEAARAEAIAEAIHHERCDSRADTAAAVATHHRA